MKVFPLAAVLAAGSTLAAQCEVFQDAGVFLPDETLFGVSVDVENDRAVVGDYFKEDFPGGTGQVHVYARVSGEWSLDATIAEPPGDEHFGTEFAHSVSLDGDRILVGQPGWGPTFFQGTVYVFRLDPGGWVQEAKLNASNAMDFDGFGRSVSLDGERAAVTNDRNEVFFLRRDGTTWSEEQKIVLDDLFVSPVVSLDGDRALVGAPGEDALATNSGAAYVYFRDATGWMLEEKLVPAELEAFDDFGSAVALDGDRAVIGTVEDDDAATGAGAAYVYRSDPGGWVLEQKLTPSGAGNFTRFGTAVALLGNRAIVTSPGDDTAAPDGGAAFLYERSGTTWSVAATLTAADAVSFDRLGSSVAFDAESAWVGALGPPAGKAFAFAIGGPDCDGDGSPDICSPALEVVRLGAPPNPNAFLPGITSGPVLGAVWDPVVDHTSFLPGAVLDFVGVSLAPANVPTSFGTLLCSLGPPLASFTGPAGVPFAIPVPNVCAFAGTALCAQAGAADAGGTVQLANALDVTLGF